MNAAFLSLGTAAILVICCAAGVCPVHCRMFSCIPGLRPPTCQQYHSPDYANQTRQHGNSSAGGTSTRLGTPGVSGGGYSPGYLSLLGTPGPFSAPAALPPTHSLTHGTQYHGRTRSARPGWGLLVSHPQLSLCSPRCCEHNAHVSRHHVRTRRWQHSIWPSQHVHKHL